MGTIAPISVFDNVLYPTDYTQSALFLQTYANVATININAFADVDGTAQSLLLGATHNLNFESKNSANMFTTTGFNMFHTNVVNSVRVNTQVLSLDVNSQKTAFMFDTQDYALDMSMTFLNKINFNSINFVSTTSSSSDIIYSNKAQGIQFSSPVVFNSNVAFEQNIVTQGSIFGSNLNVWSNRTAVLPTDLSQIGYGFRVNNHNELELIKMASFGSGNTPISKRIAVFGQGSMSSTSSDDASYLVFNNLNGVGVAGANGQIVSTSSSTPSVLDSYIFVNGTNIGVGTSGASYKLDVSGTGHFSQLLTTTAGISTGTVLPISTTTCDLGSSAFTFRNTYTENLYVGSNMMISQSPSGNPSFTDASGGPIAVQFNSIVFGSPAITLSRVNNQVQFLDSSTNAVLNAAGNLSSDPTQNNTNLIASIAAVNSVYTNLTSGNWTWNVNANGHAISNVGGLSASNATMSNLYVVNQIISPGADFAEFMPKADSTVLFAPGDVVGVDHTGSITNVYANSKHFMVVSSVPAVIGGGNQGAEDGTNEIVGFCGRVPVNCIGAQVGQHIIPAIDSSGNVASIGVDDSALTFEQYRASVGRVISINDNGLPVVILKAS